MLKTRALVLTAALALTGSLTLANEATAVAPSSCTTKVCGPEQPPAPRDCATVQAELDQVNTLLIGPYGYGLYYSVGMSTGIRDAVVIALAATTGALTQAQNNLSNVIASAPAYASGIPAAHPHAPVTGLVVTLDRQALWEQQLGDAQAEVARLSAEQAQLIIDVDMRNAQVNGYTAQLNDALALQQALRRELRSCTKRTG
jgi:hypothetical protein